MLLVLCIVFSQFLFTCRIYHLQQQNVGRRWTATLVRRYLNMNAAWSCSNERVRQQRNHPLAKSVSFAYTEANSYSKITLRRKADGNRRLRRQRATKSERSIGKRTNVAARCWSRSVWPTSAGHLHPLLMSLRYSWAWQSSTASVLCPTELKKWRVSWLANGHAHKLTVTTVVHYNGGRL